MVLHDPIRTIILNKCIQDWRKQIVIKPACTPCHHVISPPRFVNYRLNSILFERSKKNGGPRKYGGTKDEHGPISRPPVHNSCRQAQGPIGYASTAGVRSASPRLQGLLLQFIVPFPSPHPSSTFQSFGLFPQRNHQRQYLREFAKITEAIKKERLKIYAATVADMVSKIPDCARCNSSFEKERKKGRKRKHWQNEKEGEKDVTRI